MLQTPALAYDTISLTSLRSLLKSAMMLHHARRRYHRRGQKSWAEQDALVQNDSVIGTGPPTISYIADGSGLPSRHTGTGLLNADASTGSKARDPSAERASIVG